MGYPASGMRNYLARLGWSHGDDEVFSDAEARAWFDLGGIGKSPARLDFKKLENICGHHIARTEDAALLHDLQAFLSATGRPPLRDDKAKMVTQALPVLKERAKTYPELLDKAHFCLTDRPLDIDPKAAKNLTDETRKVLSDLTPQLQNATWSRQDLETRLNGFAEDRGQKFGQIAGPLRAALAGRAATPSVFDMMIVLGREETILRLEDAGKTRGT